MFSNYVGAMLGSFSGSIWLHKARADSTPVPMSCLDMFWTTVGNMICHSHITSFLRYERPTFCLFVFIPSRFTPPVYRLCLNEYFYSVLFIQSKSHTVSAVVFRLFLAIDSERFKLGVITSETKLFLEKWRQLWAFVLDFFACHTVWIVFCDIAC